MSIPRGPFHNIILFLITTHYFPFDHFSLFWPYYINVHTLHHFFTHGYILLYYSLGYLPKYPLISSPRYITNLEFEIKHIVDPYKPIIFITLTPFLVPYSQIHQITQACN